MTPKSAMTWIHVMKEGGPYTVILALLLGMYAFARLIYTFYRDNQALQEARVDDMRKLNKDNNKESKELTAAITRLATLIEGARRKRDSPNGST